MYVVQITDTSNTRGYESDDQRSCAVGPFSMREKASTYVFDMRKKDREVYVTGIRYCILRLSTPDEYPAFGPNEQVVPDEAPRVLYYTKPWKPCKRADGRMEWLCEHGVGHGNHVHECDGCCEREDYPGRPTTTDDDLVAD